MKNSKLKKGEHLYQRIKMNLYKNLTEIESVNSTNSIDIVTLISIILEYLKKDAIQLILKQIKGYKDANKIDYNKESDKIRWVLTIPAIWDEKNKYIMMEAAKKAGIVDENNKALFFALEPEAASYYCSKELEIDDSIFKKPYIICDLGGGTADIVCHERVFRIKLKK
jgi:molecular chaperone DnaK (HSP70)